MRAVGLPYDVDDHHARPPLVNVRRGYSTELAKKKLKTRPLRAQKAPPARAGLPICVPGGRSSAKRLSDGGHDKAERGEPAHSPDQQLRHAAVVPCCQRRRL